VIVGGGIPSERSDCLRMSKEECRFFPNPGNKFVEIVGRRCASARLDFLRRCSVCEKAIFLIVDEFAFLAFLDGLDSQAKLLFDLIMRHAVEI